MQHGASAPIDGAGVLAIERDDVVRPAGGILKIHVREPLPATTEAEDLDVVLAAAIGNALDDRVEAGNVAPTSENADALFRHDRLPGVCCWERAGVLPQSLS